MVSLFKELFSLLVERKKLFMLPLVIILAVLGLLLVVTQGSVVAPFIYTLF